MRNSGFHRCEDHCCYVKKYVDSYIILALYVDDMLIAGANMTEIDRLKKQLSENFGNEGSWSSQANSCYENFQG